MGFDFIEAHIKFGPVVQLVRTPPCHGGGREFESHPGRQSPVMPKVRGWIINPYDASVAQSVEQGTENPRVDGSIPSGSTIIPNSA